MTEEKTDSPDFAITELDEQLRGPEGSAVRDKILARFSQLIKSLEDKKTSGLSPDDFAATETCRKAVATAAEAVITFTQFHEVSRK